MIVVVLSHDKCFLLVRWFWHVFCSCSYEKVVHECKDVDGNDADDDDEGDDDNDDDQCATTTGHDYQDDDGDDDNAGETYARRGFTTLSRTTRTTIAW